MRVAVSVTKVFELEEDVGLSELEKKFQEHHDESSNTHSEPEIDWYDIIECQEIWSFSILA